MESTPSVDALQSAGRGNGREAKAFGISPGEGVADQVARRLSVPSTGQFSNCTPPASTAQRTEKPTEFGTVASRAEGVQELPDEYEYLDAEGGANGNVRSGYACDGAPGDSGGEGGRHHDGPQADEGNGGEYQSADQVSMQPTRLLDSEGRRADGGVHLLWLAMIASVEAGDGIGWGFAQQSWPVPDGGRPAGTGPPPDRKLSPPPEESGTTRGSAAHRAD